MKVIIIKKSLIHYIENIIILVIRNAMIRFLKDYNLITKGLDSTMITPHYLPFLIVSIIPFAVLS